MICLVADLRKPCEKVMKSGRKEPVCISEQVMAVGAWNSTSRDPLRACRDCPCERQGHSDVCPLILTPQGLKITSGVLTPCHFLSVPCLSRNKPLREMQEAYWTREFSADHCQGRLREAGQDIDSTPKLSIKTSPAYDGPTH